MPTSRDAPTGHKLFNFISTSLQSRRWAHIKRSAELKRLHHPPTSMTDQAYQQLLSTLLELHDGSSDLVIPEDMIHTLIQVEAGWFEEFRARLKDDGQPYDCRIDGWKTMGAGDPDGEFLFYRTKP